MVSLPEPLDALIAALSRLPGIGPRSAERLALHIAQADTASIHQLAQALIRARDSVVACANCGALTEQQPCAICSDPKREPALVCVVERPVDIISIEKSGAYRGRYHVLGGRISPLNGVGPEDLQIAALEARCDREPIRELILALASDVEGDATSFYLGKLFGSRGLRVTRIAQGLPVGSGLEFADELTLSRAIDGRRTLD
ncbi:MAG: recombination mediator RecR [Verrucomicrobiota bacterium]